MLTTTTKPLCQTSPTQTTGDKRVFAHGNLYTYQIEAPLYQGKTSTLYRASQKGHDDNPVIIKAAHPDGLNDLLKEANTLRALIGLQGDIKDLLTPYLPAFIEECDFQEIEENIPQAPPKYIDPFTALLGTTRGLGTSKPVRSYNALAFGFFEDMLSVSDLRDLFPDGLDAQDSAWMFRRLMMALGLVHGAGYTHNNISLSHVLVLPEQHGLVLCDWTNATDWEQSFRATPENHQDEIHAEAKQAATNDISCAAQIVIKVTNQQTMPQRLASFYRYLAKAPSGHLTAFDLLDNYKTLTEDLWGEHQFRPFEMPEINKPTTKERP